MLFGPLDAEYAGCKITHGSQSEIKGDATAFHNSSEKKYPQMHASLKSGENTKGKMVNLKRTIPSKEISDTSEVYIGYMHVLYMHV